MREHESASRGASRRGARQRNAIAVGLLLLVAAPAAWSEQPLRLLLEREPAAEEVTCIRGKLSVVRSFSARDTARAVAIADTLELSVGEDTTRLRPGERAAFARDEEDAGWRIEIETPEGARAIRAWPGGESDEADGAILIGRRADPASAGACDASVERLEDGEVMMRRLREIYASPANGRPIEFVIRP